LSEIDENAKATFSSITLATMLGLIERQRATTESVRSGKDTRAGRPGSSSSAVRPFRRRPRPSAKA
jgi:hypothetical protein